MDAYAKVKALSRRANLYGYVADWNNEYSVPVRRKCKRVKAKPVKRLPVRR